MVIQINGRNLPGSSCNPAPDHPGPYENIHVGIGRRGAPIELFSGDAASTSWRVDVRVVDSSDGSIDFRGQMVDGKRGDRFLYLNWGTVDEVGAFHLFRRAKVMLSGLDTALVRQAEQSEAELHCTVDLTDAKGHPTCARFRPPEISWSVVRRIPATR